MGNHGNYRTYGKRKRKHWSKYGKREASSKVSQPPVAKRFSLLKEKESDVPIDDEVDKVGSETFTLLSTESLHNAFSSLVCCRCHTKPSFSLSNRKGFAHNLKVVCSNCENMAYNDYTSNQKEIHAGNDRHSHHQVNYRAVFAAHKVGLKLTALNQFMAIWGVNGSLSTRTYATLSKVVYHFTNEDVNKCLEHTREKVRELLTPIGNPDDQSSFDGERYVDSDGHLCIPVSYDGTWQKRGHKSHYGLGFVIEPITGSILDFHLLSNYCRVCDIMRKTLTAPGEFIRWKNSVHKEACNKNTDGSPGAMEKEIANILWQRTTAYGFKFTKMIGDGDSKTLEYINNHKPYGPDVEVAKSECINHVVKRMRKGLDRACSVANHRGIRFAGKDKFPQERRNAFASYYKKALLDSGKDAKKASKAVWAILYHSSSTDENPKHEYCDESWCYYLQKKPKPENSRDPISPKVVEQIRPVFQTLADEDFLRKCIDLYNQNANESLHSTLWHLCSKGGFVGRPCLEAAAQTTVIKWNKGAESIMFMGDTAQAPMSPTVLKMTQAQDKQRIRDAERAQSSKIERKRKKIEENKREKRQIEKEGGPSYDPGMF